MLASILACGNAVASDAVSPIATDRPDFVESSFTVGDRVFQVETSVAYERNKRHGSDERTWTTPTLLRYGIGKTFELRLETDAFTRQKIPSSGTERGFSDTAVGFKWHTSDEAGARPSTAILVHFDLDSGSSAFRRNGVMPSVRGVAEWSLPNAMSFALMGGVMYDKTAQGERFSSGILAATVGKSFTDNFRGFVEIAGQSLTKAKYGGNIVTFDTGLAYLLNKDVQLDVAASFGLNKNTPNYALTTGISLRFR